MNSARCQESPANFSRATLWCATRLIQPSKKHFFLSQRSFPWTTWQVLELHYNFPLTELGEIKWELLARFVRVCPEKIGLKRGWPRGQSALVSSLVKENELDPHLERQKIPLPNNHCVCALSGGLALRLQPEEALLPPSGLLSMSSEAYPAIPFLHIYPKEL